MVYVPSWSSIQVELQNSYHVPSMKKEVTNCVTTNSQVWKKNLLFLSQLTASENYVVFGTNDVKVYQILEVKSLSNMEGRRIESIYVVFDKAPTCWYKKHEDMQQVIYRKKQTIMVQHILLIYIDFKFQFNWFKDMQQVIV